MKLWIDDMRQPPSDDYFWVKTVEAAKSVIHHYEHTFTDDELWLDLDHDAGDYAVYGGDYIEILNWLEKENIVDTGYFFKLHSQNPVGVQNMRAIIQHNNWREVK